MQLLSLGSMLTAGTNTWAGGYFPALLGAMPNLGGVSVVGIVLGLLIGLPLGIAVFSFPTWIASKMVAPDSATYGRAIIVNVLHVLAGIGLAVVNYFLQVLAGGDVTRALLVSAGMVILSIAIHIMIPARIYVIGAWNALGLNILSGLITVAIGIVFFVGAVALVGFANAKAPFEASVKQFQHTQKTAGLPSMPAFFSSFVPPSAPAPDRAGEIDGMLNAALHPAGPPPSLAEREDTVRLLQQKLQTQKNNLPADDAHAVAVYQNQLNRYMLLLNAVKAERRVEEARDAAARQAASGLATPRR